MIANVNPSHACFDESHNTLKYANRAKNIKIRPKMHVMTAEMTYQQRIEKLERENVQLRNALAKAQTELENQSLSKRKSVHLRHDISPDTMKKFKNFPWGESTAAAQRNSNEGEDISAMKASIKSLLDAKSRLEEEVSDLKAENQALRSRMHTADGFLRTIAEPASLPVEPAIAAPTPSRQMGLPKRIRVSPRKSSLIPRSSLASSRLSILSNQENDGDGSNSSSSSSLGQPRRVSFFAQDAPAAASRLRRPVHYRKSIGGRL
ncbi:hypothetical protein PINS_up001537 [Pythium insidiosum]|nr:hypothetical protein PINS_up001537 [Pythium insidiosum]